MNKTVIWAIISGILSGFAVHEANADYYYASGHSCGEFSGAIYSDRGIENGTLGVGASCPFATEENLQAFGVASVYVYDGSSSAQVTCELVGQRYPTSTTYYSGTVSSSLSGTGYFTLTTPALPPVGAVSYSGLSIRCVLPSTTPDSSLLGARLAQE